MGAGLAGGTNHVEQLQALRVTLDGLGNGISIERDHQGYGLRRIFECMLPDQIVALVHRAPQRDTSLLQGAYVAGDAHEDQSLLRQAGQRLGQCGFKGDAGAGVDDRFLEYQRPGRNSTTLLATTSNNVAGTA